MSEAILTEFFRIIEARKTADPAVSYTARLHTKGLHKIAQKFGEEAVEASIAGVAESKDRLARESADVLYHLLVLWAAKGITPDDVWMELERRFGVTGPALKEQRKKNN